MKEKIAEMRKNFLSQLTAASQETEQLRAKLSQLGTQSEQLKGAIYALDAAVAEASAVSAPNSNTEETAPVEEKKA